MVDESLFEDVVCQVGRGKAFLRMTWQEDRVLVRCTELGRKSLGKYWPVWLRELLLNKADPKFTLGVEVHRSSVAISGSASADALWWLVYGLAAQIRPFVAMPIAVWHENSRRPEIEWYIKRDPGKVRELAKEIDLPRGVRLEYIESANHHGLPMWRGPRQYQDNGCLRLVFRRKPGVSRATLIALVEYRFATAMGK